MPHQLSNSNASTAIGRVKSNPTDFHASERMVRFAETEAACGMQFKQTRNFSDVQPEARERIRLVETALRGAAQRSAPQASSGDGRSDRQLSNQTPSAAAQRSRRSRIVALISLALMLSSFVVVAIWLSVIHSPLAHVSQDSQSIPSPVLTAPAFLEATAGESIFLPIALDGTDGVPAHSTIAITGPATGEHVV